MLDWKPRKESAALMKVVIALVDCFFPLCKVLHSIVCTDVLGKSQQIKQVRNLCVYSRPGDRVWP